MEKLTIEKKAHLYDLRAELFKEFEERPYQIFRVISDGRWIETRAQYAFDPSSDSNDKVMAIIDGTPHPVEYFRESYSINEFTGCVTSYYQMVANGVLVGEFRDTEY